jgi:hypothetical protein
MIFLLYKLIIDLSRRFAPVSDVRRIFSVALTAQGNTSTECFNRISCRAMPARFFPDKQLDSISPAISFPALPWSISSHSIHVA